MKRLKQIANDYKRAYEKLKEAVDTAKTTLEIDGTIQRFEFTFELSWKLIKAYLEKEGIICNSPRKCFKEAYKLGIIENEDIWLEMIDDRNLTVHTYDDKTSRAIFDRIKNHYVRELKKLLELEK